METLGEDAPGGQRAGAQAASARPGRSGEGARSAMEQLIQQQLRREAQRLREEAAPAAAPPKP